MKIKRIKITDNIILGNMDILFTDSAGDIKDTIILAGENGCGKTTLLDIIYNFTNNGYFNIKEEDGNIEFTVIFTRVEKELLKNKTNEFNDLIHGNEVIIKFNPFDKVYIVFEFKKNNVTRTVKEMHLNWKNFKQIIRSLYSTAEINFNAQTIKHVTAKQLDDNVSTKKQGNDLATEISQLIVDIKALDDSDLSDWVEKNPGEIPIESVKNIRMKRFKNAFEYMFQGKKFKGIENNKDKKDIFFEENDLKISINDLSSGEKQIVFRGGFFLKDMNKINGAIILIDEPELSLHPKWQMKITEFFRKICEDEEGKQTTQIFISTHSPFILDNKYRKNDKIIVLKKDQDGKVTNMDNPKFYSCGSEQIIKQAFDIDTVIEHINLEQEKVLIITEGKTDWKHMKNAYIKLLENDEIKDLNIKFFEYEETLGDTRLQQVSKTFSMFNKNKNKKLFIFDRDNEKIRKSISEDENNEKKDYKYKKNNVYEMIIPIPEHREGLNELCIEHLYLDEDIKREKEGKRLYLGNEFSQKLGAFKKNHDIICNKKNKCGENSYKIIDSDAGVFKLEDEDVNIAMSKNDFADNIVNEVDEFKNINLDGFKLLFNKIQEIIKIEDKQN